MTPGRGRLVRLAGAVLAVTLFACGGTDDKRSGPGAGPLAWTTAPKVFRTAALPDDRVAVGSVRNTTAAPLHLVASALVVRTAEDARLPTAGQYTSGYAHGLYGAYQKPDPIPPGELARLGLAITLAPNQTAPVAVSWRLRKDHVQDRRPVVLDYGQGRLRLPVRVREGVGGA